MPPDGVPIIDVVVLHVDGCPSVPLLLERLEKAGNAAAVVVRPTLVVVHDEPTATELGMNGSPTLLVDGVDPFPANSGPALGCRLFRSDNGLDGAPSIGALVPVLLTASGNRTGS